MSSNESSNLLNPIVFCVDDNYLPYLRPLISSIVDLTPGLFDFYIITVPGTDSLDLKSQLSALAPGRITFLEFDLAQHKNYLNESSHITISTYLRLFIPHILPQNIQYSLYLDVDLLVIGSLEPLLTSKPQEIFSAVKAQGQLTHHPLLVNINHIFYGGVLLINHSRWITERITERCLEISMEYGPFDNQDNDILHLVLEGDETWGVIEPAYNVMYYEQSINGQLIQHPKVIHFPGSEKPWNSFVGGKYAKLWQARYRVYDESFHIPKSILIKRFARVSKDYLYRNTIKPLLGIRSHSHCSGV